MLSNKHFTGCCTLTVVVYAAGTSFYSAGKTLMMRRKYKDAGSIAKSCLSQPPASALRRFAIGPRSRQGSHREILVLCARESAFDTTPFGESSISTGPMYTRLAVKESLSAHEKPLLNARSSS
jgi:hypothetical protein